jgi:hypothetical protein
MFGVGAWNMYEGVKTEKPIFVPPLACAQDCGQRQV